ncbi:MAG: haloacid dehalogenase type II [Pikeienuella sp.]
MFISVCVFDAYGTLFDVAAAARRLAAAPGQEAFAPKASELAALWREKQLAYTWLRAAAGVHTDFWQVTQQALDHALAALELADPELRAGLLGLYRRLDAYPEAAEVLSQLRDKGLQTAILSNANPEMLAAAVESAGIGDRLDALLSVESVGVFKPDPRTYALVGRQFGVPARAVLFVSSNGWDAWGAAAYGFRTVWVNRTGAPRERLTTGPDRVAADLTAIPEIADAL